MNLSSKQRLRCVTTTLSLKLAKFPNEKILVFFLRIFLSWIISSSLAPNLWISSIHCYSLVFRNHSSNIPVRKALTRTADILTIGFFLIFCRLCVSQNHMQILNVQKKITLEKCQYKVCTTNICNVYSFIHGVIVCDANCGIFFLYTRFFFLSRIKRISLLGVILRVISLN